MVLQAMGQDAGMGQGGMTGGHHHKDHHKRHEAEAAGVGVLGAAGVAEHEHHKVYCAPDLTAAVFWLLQI